MSKGKDTKTTRRRFLTAAAVGGAAIAMPQVSRAQTATLKMQGSWGKADVFNEMAEDYVKRVNEMAGGRLRIDYLVGGAVVHPFQVFDGVHGGQIDAAHTVTVYWYGKHKAASLFGTGPVFGFNANEGLGWIHNGGGRELFEELQNQIMKVNIKSFFAMPMPTQPLGWFKKPITKADDMKGVKFRTVGISIDVFTGMGAAVNALPGGEIVAALDRGLLDAAEFNNASSDRILGFPDVSKVCMLQSYHQNAEQFEIMFNKDKYNALPEKIRAILDNAAEAAGQDMAWKAIDRYSKDYAEMQTKDNVKFYKTPDSVLQAQLDIYDQVVEKKSAENPLFKEIVASQLAFAKRATQWEQDTVVNRRMAYNHYFGPNAKKKT